MSNFVDDSTEKGKAIDACQKEALGQGQVLVGYIQKINHKEEPEVVFYVDQTMHSYVALSTVPISMNLLGRNVVLAFVGGEISRPIVMGLLVKPLGQMPNPTEQEPKLGAQSFYPADYSSASQTASLEDNISVVKGKDRVEIKCGAASITLTREGKILLRGKYISSRSSGANRIKGGSILIN